MKTRYVLLLVFAFVPVLFSAQERSGYVTDRKGDPVDLATVVLMTADKQEAVAVTDEMGFFTLCVANGAYILKIRNITYRPFDHPVTIKEGQLDLGVFELDESTVGLDEVIVSSSVITREPDRFVMRINQVPSMLNKDAAEVLKLAPGVWVDDNGVSINGASGATVFINDRELRLTKKELVDYLRNFRSSDIARVEVIPQAGADYSADAQGGVVKIILRRQPENGISGNMQVGTSQGAYVSNYRPSAAINARVGRWMLSALGSGGLSRKGKSELMTTRTFYNETDHSFYSRSQMNRQPRSGMGRVGAIYEPDRRNSFGAEFEFSSKKRPYPSQAETILAESGIVTKGLSHYKQDEQDRDISATFNYIYALDTIGSTLKFIADYTDKKVTGENDYHSEFEIQEFSSDSIYRNTLLSRYKVFTADLSLNKRLAEGIRFSAGGKYTRNDMMDTVSYESYYQSDWKPLADYSFLSDYTEDIGAIYGILTAGLGRFDLSAGLRGEYTYTKGRKNSVKQSYFDLFPNATITYSFNAMRTFMLVGQYARNIQRPNFWYLNPNRIQYSDYSYMVGNPKLRPTYINRFSITAVYKYRYTLSVGGNLHADLIREVTKIDPSNPDVTYIMPENHHTENHYFIALGVPLRITDLWNVNANVVGVKQDIRGTETDRRMSHYLYFINLTTDLTLPAEFLLELTYNGTSRLYSANSGINSRHLFHLTIKKPFFDNRLTASVGLNNIFNSKASYFSKTERFDTKIAGVEAGSSRYLKLSLQYNFNSGKSFKKRTIERALNEDKSRMERASDKK